MRRSGNKIAAVGVSAAKGSTKAGVEGDARASRSAFDTRKGIVKAGRMPPLPKDFSKIVIRPPEGLEISRIGAGAVADAIVLAAGVDEEEAMQDIICPNLQQNIIVASTPDQDRASKYFKVKNIDIDGKVFEVSAYATAPHDTCKGVIRGIPISDTQDILNRKIVNANNPLALHAKRIKDTGTIITAFEGHKAPSGDPKSTPFAKRPAAMHPRLGPPGPPFHPPYPRAWFIWVNGIHALNGVKAQPLMHAVLLNALPVELCHLAAASSSSPRPYDDLCAAVPACCGETYRLLPGSRACIPAPNHHDEVIPSYEGQSRVPATHTSSPTSTVHHNAKTSDSTTATLPHALESGNVIVSPAIRHPITLISPSTMSHEHDLQSTSTLCASCKQRPSSSSKSSAAEVPAHDQLRTNFRDAATMTETTEDYVPGSSMAESVYSVPAALADNHQTAPTSTGAPTGAPAKPTPAQFRDVHYLVLLTRPVNQQECNLNAGTLEATA
ncbi:hypothetical protein HPB52_000644 [Rhipicephalus sanguineus]|uniref:Uncharacterized protein n=1 Tax=Rhipicephalus sanguineus TaxID=34632 RepID=A0A9D4ST31_RHISA|nr:hypothetical protein HPB52_000644 [Rhipicephalus sanguineus]